MRVLIMALALGLIALTAAWAAKDEAPRCENCNMFWEKSPTRVQAVIEVEDEVDEHIFECLGCLHDFVHENYGEVKPAELRILDYATFGSDDEQMIDAFKAYFLFGTERLQFTMPPYVVAFSSEEAALEAQQVLKGELVDFAGMVKLMQEAKSETVEEDAHSGAQVASPGKAEDVYVCSCSGGCCDDIQSSEPGQCPQCGMELKQK